ncbi:MAG: FMN-binding negative transcriptional regulator [Alphaproteobacteria bacterium]|nr:FMN-binding negative transcriptional regulator [Alphaproteobacteria bacterium]MCW5741771.1 FMN-binding negative transcriptional regulator [Alphaproteobacteria bacterium]
MYAPPLFDLTDAAAIRGIIRAHPFAALVSTGEDGVPYVTHLPLIHVEDGSANGHLVGHVARPNPHWRLFGKAPTIAIFGGANAYISPNWYTSADMVPTWNYQAVHAHGTPVIVTDDNAALDVVVKLSAFFEAALPRPWTIDKMTPGKALGMVKGIVAFTMPVARFEAKSKIGQNRTPADQRGAAEALLALGGTGNAAIGELMRKAADARD